MEGGVLAPILAAILRPPFLPPVARKLRQRVGSIRGWTEGQQSREGCSRLGASLPPLFSSSLSPTSPAMWLFGWWVICLHGQHLSVKVEGWLRKKRDEGGKLRLAICQTNTAILWLNHRNASWSWMWLVSSCHWWKSLLSTSWWWYRAWWWYSYCHCSYRSNHSNICMATMMNYQYNHHRYHRHALDNDFTHNKDNNLQDPATEEFPLLMPRVHPGQAESYLCTPIRWSLPSWSSSSLSWQCWFSWSWWQW